MAYNFRIATATDPTVQNFLGQLQQFQPNDVIYSAIESGDKTAFQNRLSDLPDSYISQADKQKLISQFDQVQSKLPSQGEGYATHVRKVKDEANATDEELQNKIAAYQGLTKVGEPLPYDFIRSKIIGLMNAQDVKGRVKIKPGTSNPYDLSANSNVDVVNQQVAGLQDTIANNLSKFIVQARRLPTPSEFRDFYNAQGGQYGNGDLVLRDSALTNFLNNQNNSNYIALDLGGQEPSHDDDIQRIQDILDTRQDETNKTNAVTKYLQTTPSELAAARGGFYKQAQDSQTQYLRTRLAPKIISDLNARGLAEGPDVGSAIAASGAGLQAGLESKIRDLEASDNQFFADSAFRIAQARLNSTEDQLNQQIAFERAKTAQNQEAGFNAKETDINNEFEQELLKKAGDRELNNTQSDINFETDQNNSKTIAGLTDSLGRSVGQTVATKIATSGTKKASPSVPSNIG